VPGFVTRRPDNHHHSIGKKSDRLIADLTVVPSDVSHGDGRTIKDDRHICEIKAPLVERGLAFSRDRI